MTNNRYLVRALATLGALTVLYVNPSMAEEGAPSFSTRQTNESNYVSLFENGALDTCVVAYENGVKRVTDGKTEAFLVTLNAVDIGPGKDALQVTGSSEFDLAARTQDCSATFDFATGEFVGVVRIDKVDGLNGLHRVKLKHIGDGILEVTEADTLADNLSNELFFTSKEYGKLSLEAVVFDAKSVTATNSSGAQVEFTEIEKFDNGSSLWRGVATEFEVDSVGSSYSVTATNDSGATTLANRLGYWNPGCDEQTLFGVLCGDLGVKNYTAGSNVYFRTKFSDHTNIGGVLMDFRSELTGDLIDGDIPMLKQSGEFSNYYEGSREIPSGNTRLIVYAKDLNGNKSIPIATIFAVANN